MEQKGKRIHGHGQQGGGCRERGITGLNDNGKNYNNKKKKNEQSSPFLTKACRLKKGKEKKKFIMVEV